MWLMLEGIVGTKNLCYKHVGIFSDYMTAVSWSQRGAAKKSAAAGRLLRVLYLWQQVTRASPLVAAHVAGVMNVLEKISSLLFGYFRQWHCTKDSVFISLINS